MTSSDQNIDIVKINNKVPSLVWGKKPENKSIVYERQSSHCAMYLPVDSCTIDMMDRECHFPLSNVFSFKWLRPFSTSLWMVGNKDSAQTSSCEQQ